LKELYKYCKGESKRKETIAGNIAKGNLREKKQYLEI